MSEEEIIKDIDVIFYNLEDMMSESSAEAERAKWQQLKDLYKAEKALNQKYKKYWQQVLAFFKKDYVHKDKIKAKIEELEKEHNKYKGNLGLQYSKAGLINSQIQVLEELMKEGEENV